MATQEARKTHRCRFYLTQKNMLDGIDLYGEVWDTLEKPYPEADLPKGEPAVMFTGSYEQVMREVEAFRRRPDVMTGDHASRGSI